MQDLHSVAYFLNLGQQQEIQELEQFARTGQLVIAISNLLHQLQYERGLSNSGTAAMSSWRCFIKPWPTYCQSTGSMLFPHAGFAVWVMPCTVSNDCHNCGRMLNS